MAILTSILKHNQSFVEEKGYEFYETTKFPEKKLVILTCMDTRLLELLHHAMGLKNGDAKIIKNAGAVVSHPLEASCARFLWLSMSRRLKKSA